MTELIPTAAIADASVRIGVSLRIAPKLITPLVSGMAFAGQARPITHLATVPCRARRRDRGLAELRRHRPGGATNRTFEHVSTGTKVARRHRH
jgi:hypothetical protein